MMRKARRREGTKARRHEGTKAQRLAASRRRARGFTLVELMIAVAVLIVIIIATSKIFGTVGKVTSLGQATADVLQETTAIERQLRGDFERLAPNGVFAIRCVSIRNDINVPVGPLLNPALPEDAMIRADQLLFFTNGVQSIQTYRQDAGFRHKGQATAARVYYGHAFQLPEAEAITPIDDEEVRAHDPILDPADPLVPWYFGANPYQMVRTVFRSDSAGTPPDYDTFPGGDINATQPIAPQWLMTRHAVLLADDGGNEVVFLGHNRSAFTIADPVVRNSRVDAAATQLNDIRNAITLDSFGDFRPWFDPSFGEGDQRTVISSAVFYPRAERVAPGMHRVDQALTNNVLAGACSSFIVDWTYEEGVGAAFNEQGTFFAGFDVETDLAEPNSSPEHPWFGLDSDVDGNGDPDRGVFTYDSENWWTGADTIFFENIEQYDPPGTVPVEVYEAFFGYNRDRPLDDSGSPNSALGYTPWPSAIRITMILHDPDTKLEVGREVQFVINLPKRVR